MAKPSHSDAGELPYYVPLREVEEGLHVVFRRDQSVLELKHHFQQLPRQGRTVAFPGFAPAFFHPHVVVGVEVRQDVDWISTLSGRSVFLPRSE